MGGFYCDSEVGSLPSVLMHRPGRALGHITLSTYGQWLYEAPMEQGRFRAQFDRNGERKTKALAVGLANPVWGNRVVAQVRMHLGTIESRAKQCSRQ